MMGGLFKKKEKPKEPPRASAPAGGGEGVDITAAPTVESNLTHMTRDRPMIQRQRRPPTRKPRAAAGED